MPYSRMSPEETANLFRSGIVAVGPKRDRESTHPCSEPLLTPEQDWALGELMQEQSRAPATKKEK